MFHTFENAEAKQNAETKQNDTKQTEEKYGKMAGHALANELVNLSAESPTNKWSFEQWRRFVDTSKSFQVYLKKNHVINQNYYDYDEKEYKNGFIMHQQYNYDAEEPENLDHVFVLNAFDVNASDSNGKPRNTGIQYQLYTKYDENEEMIDWKKRSQGKLTLIEGQLTLSHQNTKKVNNVTYIEFLQYRNQIFKGTSFNIEGTLTNTDTGVENSGRFDTSSLFGGNLDLKGEYKNFTGKGTLTWGNNDTFKGTFKYETYDDKRYIIGQYDPNFDYYRMSRELELEDYETKYNIKPIKQDENFVPFRDIKDCRVRVMFRNFIIFALHAQENMGLLSSSKCKADIENVKLKLSE